MNSAIRLEDRNHLFIWKLKTKMGLKNTYQFLLLERSSQNLSQKEDLGFILSTLVLRVLGNLPAPLEGESTLGTFSDMPDTEAEEVILRTPNGWGLNFPPSSSSSELSWSFNMAGIPPLTGGSRHSNFK